MPLVALSLLPTLEASEFEAGAPVVMLELPEAPAAPSTPPSDLAPGPPEEESEPTPPPKEETKPPEQEAEVALPMPEPPKPEPPAEQHEATAMPSVEMPPSAAAPPTPGAAVQTPASFIRWQSALVAHIERFKRYPAEARARGEHGIARVAFTIDHDGHLVSEPHRAKLRVAACSTRKPSPCWRAPSRCRGRPADAPDSELSFVVPVRFNIR